MIWSMLWLFVSVRSARTGAGARPDALPATRATSSAGALSSLT